MKKALLTAVLVVAAVVCRCQTAIGHWRDCLDYSWTNHVTYAGDRIYAAARGGIFCYDFEDNTLTRL